MLKSFANELVWFRNLNVKYIFQSKSILIVFILHVLAISIFFPPNEWFKNTPLRYKDYPVHTYRVEIFKESFFQNGIPWGYDTSVGAGLVLNPGHAIGARGMQVLSIFVPFLNASQVVRISIPLFLLLLPFCIVYALISLKIEEKYHFYILLSALLPFWFVRRIFLFATVGMASFILASFLALLVLALFVRYLNEKDSRTYFYLVIVSSFGFMIHPLGVFVILPVLVFFTIKLFFSDFLYGLRLALLPVSIIALNIFWFYPFVMARFVMPDYSEPQPLPPPDFIPHLTNADVNELLIRFTDLTNLSLLVFSVLLFSVGIFYLYKKLHRTIFYAFSFSIIFGLLITYSGSFIDGFADFQPLRFLNVTVVIMAVPMGVAIYELMLRSNLINEYSQYAILTIIVILAIALGRPWKFTLMNENPLIVQYINANVDAKDRVALQSKDGYLRGDYDSRIVPLVSDVEIIGSNFPKIYDPPQFLSTMFMGKEITKWKAASLGETLEAWDITKVITRTDEAEKLFASLLGQPVDSIGPYRFFETGKISNKVLIGEGEVVARLNEIHVNNIVTDRGAIVLKYRFHPAWEVSDGAELFRYQVSEDPAGLIGIRNISGSELNLSFNSLSMLTRKWPDYSSME